MVGLRKNKNIFLTAAGVIVLAALSAFLGLAIKQDRMIEDSVYHSAASLFDSILTARRWNASHGGVYVKKTDGIESNPYLEKPDIITTDGDVYTLKNPALMTREISAMVDKNAGYRYHMTSLKPTNPVNKPDDWEREALLSFEKGAHEATAVQTFEDKKYYRLIRPLQVEKNCLQCHAKDGYKLGDVRGGISVMIDYDDIYGELKDNHIKMFLLACGVVAVFIFVFYMIIWKLFSTISNTARQLEEEKLKLETLNRELDSRVEERTRELASANEWLKKEMEERAEAQKYISMLATAVEQVPDAIIITSIDGTITYVNPAVTCTTGYTTAELLGRKPNIFKSGKQDDHFYSVLWQTILSGKVWKGRFTNKTKQGSEIIQDASIAPIKDATDRIVGFVSASSDVTQHIEMENRIVQSQKMEAMGTLAGGIAHDFNNILSAVDGYTELALLKCTDADLRDNLEQVHAASKRAAELVKQILTFSRMSKEEAQPLQLKPLVKEALKLLRASIPSSIEIRQNLGSDSTALIDPSEIHRIMMNLCTNAALAMEEQNGLLEVTLDNVEMSAVDLTGFPEAKPGGYVRLRVKDTGSGMPEETRNRIFDPFFTTRCAGKGTGMGLSVVMGIVKRRNGTITVESEPGKGSLFTICFPAIEGYVAKKGVILDVPATGTERILFVDDEATVAKLAQRSLSRLGYTVTIFTDSVEALDSFRSAPGDFDVIVTDLTMPRLTGEKLAREAKGIRPDIPVVLCTGFSEKITKENAAEYGIDEFAMKPVAATALSWIIRRAVKNTRAAGRQSQ